VHAGNHQLRLKRRRVGWVNLRRACRGGNDSCALSSCRTASVSAGREKNPGKVATVRGGVIAPGWIPRPGLRCDPQRIPLVGILRALRLEGDWPADSMLAVGVRLARSLERR